MSTAECRRFPIGYRDARKSRRDTRGLRLDIGDAIPARHPALGRIARRNRARQSRGKIAPGFRPGLQPKLPRVPYNVPATAYSRIPPIYAVYAPPYASVRAGRSPTGTLSVKKANFSLFPAFFPGRNPAGTLSAGKRGFPGFPCFLPGKIPAGTHRVRNSARKPACPTPAPGEVPPGLSVMTSADMSVVLRL